MRERVDQDRPIKYGYFFFLILFLMFLYFLRHRAQAGEGQREKETQYEAGSRLRAVSTEPDTGPEPTNCEIVT